MYMQTWIEKPASNSSQPPPVVVYLRKSFTKIFAMLRLAYTFTKSTTFAGSRTNRPHYLKTPNPIPTNCTVLDHDTAFTCTVAILKPCLQQSRTTTHTVFTRSDATATIYLVHQFCAASIRERCFFAQPIPALMLKRAKTLLFWVCFVSSRWVFACAHAT